MIGSAAGFDEIGISALVGAEGHQCLGEKSVGLLPFQHMLNGQDIRVKGPGEAVELRQGQLIFVITDEVFPPLLEKSSILFSVKVLHILRKDHAEGLLKGPEFLLRDPRFPMGLQKRIQCLHAS